MAEIHSPKKIKNKNIEKYNFTPSLSALPSVPPSNYSPPPSNRSPPSSTQSSPPTCNNHPHPYVSPQEQDEVETSAPFPSRLRRIPFPPPPPTPRFGVSSSEFCCFVIGLKSQRKSAPMASSKRPTNVFAAPLHVFNLSFLSLFLRLSERWKHRA